MTYVAGDLISLDYALQGLQYKGTDVTRDTDIRAYITAATPVIESIVGPVLQRTHTRAYTGGKSAIILTDPISDAAAVTAVTEDGVAITDFIVDPDNGILYAGTATGRRHFVPGIRNIVVTALVGYSPVPATLQLAARELVVHWVQQGTQPPAGTFDPVTGAPNDSALVPLGYAIPRRVAQLCEPFRRQAGLA